MAERAQALGLPPPPTLDRWAHVDRNQLGVILFITSESIFFLSLIAAYVVYRGKTPPSEGLALLDIGRTGIFTVCLLASSVTVALASARLRRDDRGGYQLWLLATILLGAIFIGGQSMEYMGLLRANLAPSSNLFGSTFFTLTGFHGFHVLVGLCALLIMFGISFTRDLCARMHKALEPISLYWHFVDGVWVVVFSVIYVWALL